MQEHFDKTIDLSINSKSRTKTSNDASGLQCMECTGERVFVMLTEDLDLILQAYLRDKDIDPQEFLTLCSGFLKNLACSWRNSLSHLSSELLQQELQGKFLAGVEAFRAKAAIHELPALLGDTIRQIEGIEIL